MLRLEVELPETESRNRHVYSLRTLEFSLIVIRPTALSSRQ